ncbi:putative pentatricopeptide repeat-containing protein At3g47840 isoform X1 [Euphorbia lathyris]|uniref:putative pentatricopeptide repeat-containing protein At3g47840 isoform X1 n=1 Tax=Euphorbia lathyris TaxID=212925 RepID=UPI00331360D8
MVFSLRPYIRRLCTASASVSAEFTDHVGYSAPNKFLQKTQLPNLTDMLEINSKLKYLVKTGCLQCARQMFDKMHYRDEISWTIIISGYANVNATEALTLFSKMWVQPGLQMDPFVLSLALKVCGLNLNMSFGESMHAYSVKTDFVDSVFVGSALLDMYMKVGKIKQGCMVFDEMSTRNVVSWTAVITGLVHAGYGKLGLEYFSEMWRSKVACDSHTFAIALKACANLGSLNHGREIHCQTLKRSLEESSFVANTLATMYNKCGKLEYGLHLFEKMTIRDVVSWTMIIATYAQTGKDENALRAFIRMQELGVSPNEFTFAAVISSCANLGRIEWGEQLHGYVLCLGLISYLPVSNSVMTMYSKCGLVTSASLLFQELNSRDVVSWSTIIAGYSQEGRGEEAFEYLSRMAKEGTRLNEFTLSSLLSVCGNMVTLEQGKQLHAHAFLVGLEKTEMVQSALINMYSKCGSIKEASKVLDEAEINDVISLTAMVNGYAENGCSQEAIDLFEKIPLMGLRPDPVAFIGVLTACCHAGLVDIGFHYFDLMTKEYQIFPSKEHYGCMIDLLCRAGRLNDAESMIKSMPFQRDDVVWSSLLRACREHGDVECGRRAAEKILELDPNCASTHITLANMYAAKGRWKEAANARKMMRIKGIVKEPGWSWIKIKDLVSAFVSHDKTHPQGENIYSMLKLLVSEVEMSVLELDSLVNDVQG